MKRISIGILATLLFLLTSASSYAFNSDAETHRPLSENAVRSSNLDNFLTTQLNFLTGINEMVDGRRVFEWVGEGSVREDDGDRFCNHFHNPLLAWGQAGLSFPCSFSGNNSSVIWGQSPDNEFSWQKARENYFSGLTASSPFVRGQQLALTFRTLGHLVHLAQDASLPAHTRDDEHPLFDGFERFVQNIRINDPTLFSQLTSTSTGFNPSILTLPTNPLAPIPIARIIDTDQPGAIPSAGTNIGMAEYSNGNFLSDDRIFTPDFAFPAEGSLGTPFVEVNGRTYRPKVLDGEVVDHFVAQDEFGNYFLSQGANPDSFIFTDYGAKLLPRAIGYSAGLTDYFFRGRLEVLQQADQPAAPTEVRLKVRNSTPTEESGTGQIVGVVQFFGGTFAVSSPQTVNLGRDFQEIGFEFGSPFFFFPQFFTVVYNGPLGMEEPAVIAKTFRPRIDHICDGRGGRRFCGSGWKVPAVEATLTIEAKGLNNSG